MEAANAESTCLWLSRSAARLEIDVNTSRIDSARMGTVSLLVPELLIPGYDGDVAAADEVERESFMAKVSEDEKAIAVSRRIGEHTQLAASKFKIRMRTAPVGAGYKRMTSG